MIVDVKVTTHDLPERDMILIVAQFDGPNERSLLADVAIPYGTPLGQIGPYIQTLIEHTIHNMRSA